MSTYHLAGKEFASLATYVADLVAAARLRTRLLDDLTLPVTVREDGELVDAERVALR